MKKNEIAEFGTNSKSEKLEIRKFGVKNGSKKLEFLEQFQNSKKFEKLKCNFTYRLPYYAVGTLHFFIETNLDES
jgi:hypothetical protein